MCDFPNNQFRSVAERFSRNTRKPCGQCGRDRTVGAEISAAAASIAGVAKPFPVHKIQGFVGFSPWHGVC
jgi:hypothetical protein